MAVAENMVMGTTQRLGEKDQISAQHSGYSASAALSLHKNSTQTATQREVLVLYKQVFIITVFS